MMQFELRSYRNLEYREADEKTPKYFFEIDLSKLLPGTGRVARLPVFWRPNRARHPILKELYWTDVGGERVEKGNLVALEKALPEAIVPLIVNGTLPYYFFKTPAGSFPAYLSHGKLHLRFNGASFSGDDVGQLWHRLGEYLQGLGKVEEKEEIEVSIFLWNELQIYPTAFVLRNGKAWMPVFIHREGGAITLNYDLIGAPSRFLEPEQAFDLRREVAMALAESRAIASPGALKIDQVREEIWARMEVWVKPAGFVLVYHQDGQRGEIPVYEAKGEFLALQHSSRARLIFSSDPDELSQLVSQDLVQRGRMASTSILAVEKRG